STRWAGGIRSAGSRCSRSPSAGEGRAGLALALVPPVRPGLPPRPHALAQREVVRRVHERDVRPGLREVAELALERGVVFLGEEPEIVLQREQPLEDLPGLVLAVLQAEVVDEPEGACEEDALAGRQPVDLYVLLVGGV